MFMDVEGVFFKLVVTINCVKQLFPTFLIGSLSGFSFVGPTGVRFHTTRLPQRLGLAAFAASILSLLALPCVVVN
ncbi:hypothetical protein SHEWT2_03443 [Shewanella hafniensis]|jgi:hypothetical protein|nr:hypothetical protein SHEWT2_03443 [Shewanella hafniensis]